VLIEGALPGAMPEPKWGRTDEILSCAASLKIRANGDGEPLRTNVEGTRALIEYAQRHDIRRIHAVSTAYVCGSYTQDVREIFHEPQPHFQTDYEASKWLAEKLLCAWGRAPGNTLTILRPSFLVGHSQSGYTTQFGGFYQFARMMSILKERFRENGNGAITHVPLRIPGRPDDPQNFVPVDFAARVTAEVVLNPAFHGRIFHVTDPAPFDNDHFKRCVEDYFRLQGGYFSNGDGLANKNAAESMLWDGADWLAARVVHNPRFVADNTIEVMHAAGIEFPALTRSRVFKMLDYAKEQRWGNGHSER
jgi:nucleoside-diphosphate-sugar epimerase